MGKIVESKFVKIMSFKAKFLRISKLSLSIRTIGHLKNMSDLTSDLLFIKNEFYPRK